MAFGELTGAAFYELDRLRKAAFALEMFRHLPLADVHPHAQLAALLDKRDPKRSAATGNDLNSAPTLGAASGNAAQLSQSEIDALRARLMGLWNPPVGIQNPQDFVIRVRIRLGRDGKLSAPPIVLTSGTGTLFSSARDSAVRAVFQGQPFDMLRPEHYETWKDIEVTFDPRDMFRG